MKSILLIILSLISLPSLADIETDKVAGNCAGLIATYGSKQGVAKALNMADNPNRAMEFSGSWMNDVERYQNNSSMVQGLVYKASGDCRKIGIRASDYSKK